VLFVQMEDADITYLTGLVPSVQRHRQVDVVAPGLRAAHKRNNAGPPADPDRSRREQDEAMRILEATTPEM